MARIALVLTLLICTAVLPAQAAAPAPGAAPAPAAAKQKKCKKGYVLKTVKRNGKKVKRCVKKKPAPQQQPGGTPTPADPDPSGGEGAGGGAGTGQPAPTPGANQAPPSTTTRDDGAGQQAMGTAGDLMLERAEFGNVTATYYRIWMLQNGYFKYVEVSWSQQTGEICDKVNTGTWAFKEGYTFTESGGGTVVKVTITFSNGQGGDDLVTFANRDSQGVYIGAKGTRFERNPNMLNNC
jgi:hypothetical protein